MAKELSPEVRALAEAIEAASLKKGPLVYGDVDLTRAVRFVERVMTETFAPRSYGDHDYPVVDPEQARWASSVEAAEEEITLAGEEEEEELP